MATHSEIDVQLKRLASLYRPLQPAVLKDGKPNPAHVAMRAEYHRCLEAFASHEIQMGFDDLIASWKYQGWPSPADCAGACAEHVERKRLPSPEKATEILRVRAAAIRRMVRNNLRPPMVPGTGDWLWKPVDIDQCHRAGLLSAEDAAAAQEMVSRETEGRITPAEAMAAGVRMVG